MSGTILIVGAGDYIGAAIAKRFAAGGFIVCPGRRNGDKLAPLLAEITSSGGAAHGFTPDARDEDNVAAVIAQIETEIGPLDLVVFNVGGNVRFPIRETTARVFRKVWEMACFGGFLTGKAAAEVMVPRGKGAIFSQGPPPACAAAPGFQLLPRPNTGSRHWRNPWHASWDPRASMWRIWSLTQASIPPGCATSKPKQVRR